MKGYKALSMEMKAVNGNGMQYEMGRLYSIEGDVIPCKNGFHFCKSIEELNGYYNIVDSRIFEVEVYGQVIEHGDKYAAEKIRLRREFTKEEIKSYFKRKQRKFVQSNNWHIRQAVAEQGFGLNVLIHDGCDDVRSTVAKQGYGLEELLHDRSFVVRCAVAEQGYRLDELIHDEDWQVRCTTVEQGYGLDALLYDEDWIVRAAVAEQRYGLDILIYDRDWQVRKAVAKQGCGLDILIRDEHWCVRVAVAEQGYGLDELIHDNNNSVRLAAWKMLKCTKS